MRWTPWLCLATRQRGPRTSGSRKREESWSMRHPGGDRLVDEAALAEPLEAEGCGEGARLALGHQLGHGPARAGDGLETASAPAAVDEAVAQGRLRDDG